MRTSTSRSAEPAALLCPVTRVLVPLDGTEEAERALEPAVALARTAGAPLWPVSVADLDAHHERVPYLERLAARLPVEHVDPDVIWSGRAGETIGDLALSYNRLHGGLVVCMNTRARAAVPELVLGSTAAEIVRSGGAPVVLVGPQQELVGWEPRTLVACLDGSRLSEAILPTVVAWSKALALAVWLVQSVDADLARKGDTDESGYLQHQSRRLAAAGVEADWEVLHEPDAAAGIAAFAGALPGALIATTTHGRSGLQRVTMGSVATDIVRHSRVPVLVSRPSLFEPDDTADGVG